MHQILFSGSVYLRLMILLFVATIPLVVLGHSPISAQENNQTIIVLDGSRSMWQRLKKTRKYKASRFFLNKILDTPKARDPFGILTFGTRSRRSCKTVRTLKPLKDAWSDQHVKALKRFKPRGRSPISTSLETAADILDYKNKRGKIVMIVDGYDDCRRDPCETLDFLRLAAHNLSVHVIGLKMRRKWRRKYRCFASHPSDAFYPVKNEAELVSALLLSLGGDRLATSVAGTEQAARQGYRKPEVKPDQIAQLLKGAPRVKLFAVLSQGTAPLREGVSWKIYKAITDSSFRGRPLASSGKSQPEFQLKPGGYVAEAVYGQVRAEQHIIVPRSGALTHIVDLRAGRLQVKTRESAEGKLVNGVFYTLYQLDDAEEPIQPPIARSNKADTTFVVNEGSYLLTATHGGHRLERKTQVVSGSRTNVTLEMNIGVLQLSASATRKSKPLERVFYSIHKDDGAIPLDQINGKNEIARTGASAPVFRLPAGRYIVKAEHDLASLAQRVLVKTGKTLKIHMNLNAAQLSLTSKLKGTTRAISDRISYRLFKLEKDGTIPEKEIVRTSKSKKNYVLTPGSYLISGRYGPVNAKQEKRITLKPGAKQNIVLNYEAGTARLTLLDKNGGYPRVNVFWTIFDKNEREIWRTSRPTPELVLKTGLYKAVAESQGKRYEQLFTIETGKEIDIKLVSD